VLGVVWVLGVLGVLGIVGVLGVLEVAGSQDVKKKVVSRHQKSAHSRRQKKRRFKI
jgi:hypothetical protein